MTTSTLAGEYVTARVYVGGRATCGKMWDMNIMYKTRVKGEVTVGAVHVVEEGAADDGIWGHHGPPKLWNSLFSFVFLFVVSGQKGRRSTRARGG